MGLCHAWRPYSGPSSMSILALCGAGFSLRGLWCCSAGVSPAGFSYRNAAQNRRREAGATRTTPTVWNPRQCNTNSPKIKIKCCAAFLRPVLHHSCYDSVNRKGNNEITIWFDYCCHRGTGNHLWLWQIGKVWRRKFLWPRKSKRCGHNNSFRPAILGHCGG